MTQTHIPFFSFIRIFFFFSKFLFKNKQKKGKKNSWKLHGSSGEKGEEEHGAEALSLSRESPHPPSALFVGRAEPGQPPMPSPCLKRAVTVVQGPEGLEGDRGQRGHRK